MLTFNLKKEWFEKIKSGEKKHEYRVASPYWTKRLLKVFRQPNEIKLDNMKIFSIPVNKYCLFALGYPSKDEKDKFILAKITRFSRYQNGYGTDLNTAQPVFIMEFKKVKEIK